jgi:excisionase family DNA binding protein
MSPKAAELLEALRAELTSAATAGDLPALLAEIERLRAEALLAPRDGPEKAADRLLTVAEAAQRLSLSRDWLYRQRGLPFEVRLPGGARRFSEQGLERWLKRRQG